MLKQRQDGKEMNYGVGCGMTPPAPSRLRFLIPPPIRTSPNVFRRFKREAVVCYKSFKIHSYKIHGGGKNFVVVIKLLLFVHSRFQSE